MSWQEGFGIGVIVVLYLLALCASVALNVRAWEDDWPPIQKAIWGVVGCSLVSAGIGALAVISAAEENKGPCIRHETRYTNGQPYRVCVERGEWIKE